MWNPPGLPSGQAAGGRTLCALPYPVHKVYLCNSAIPIRRPSRSYGRRQDGTRGALDSGVRPGGAEDARSLGILSDLPGAATISAWLTDPVIAVVRGPEGG